MTTQTRLPEDFKAAYEYHKSQGDFTKAKRVADLYRQQLAGQPQPTQQQTIAPPVAVADRDNALQFSVDQLQKTGGNLIEFAGRATGMPSIEQYGRDVIEQQETDIAEGGYQSSYADPLKDYIQRGDYGTFAKALGTKMAENAASVGVAPATVAAATGAAVYGAPAAVIAGLSALGTAATVGLGIGEAVGEQKDKLGDFNTATAGATGLLIGLLDRVGAKGILKADTLANMSLKDIAKVLKDKGPAGSAKKFLRAFRDEFLTEGAQESTLIGATALQGGQYTGDEVLGRVSDASLIGGATGGSIRGAVDATNAAKSELSGVLQKAQKLQFNKPQKVEDLGEITEGNFIEAPAVGRGRDQKIATEDKFSDIEREKVATARGAKGAMARRLIDKVVLDEYDLTDVATASTSGARAAIDSIHKDLVSALKLSAGNIKKTYKETLAKDELSVLEKVTSKAQNKTKNVVDNSDISEVLDILGNTPEAVDFINLALQLNEVTILHNAGYIGGVSKLTDQFLPFTDVTGINYNPQRQTPTVTNTAAQFVTSPIGITGRAIDKITGRRFPLQRYMEQNKNAPGLPLPERGGKVALAIAAQERENQQTDKFNRATDSLLAEQLSSDDAIMGSPRDIFGRGTGLRLPDIISTLENLSAEAQDADVKALYDANVVALQTGTESAPNMSAVIAQVRRRIAQDPALQALQIAPAEATGARANLQQNQTAGQALTSQANINYERGVQANRDRAKSLQEQLMADKAISASDKALIGAKLDELQYGNLGVRPLESLNSMLRSLKESNVSIEAVDNYFMPAAMAIGKQQKNAPKPADDSELALSYTPALAPFTPRVPPSIPKPTVGEVKEQLPEADAKFSIGKKGSKYENGLPTFDDAKRFIAELGYSLNLYQNFDAFNRDMKAMSGEERDRMTTKGSFARRTGTILINPMQGNLERFLTVLHETGHGLGKTNTNSNLFMPMLEEGSFESLVENNSKIQNEMAAIQRDEYRRELSDGRTVRQDVRSGIDMAVSGSMTIEEAMQLSDYQEYAATNTERVADAFAFYLFDPKRMKSNYPATAKEIQNYFKRLQKRDPSMPVTFQANPLTVILAAVMAGVAQMAAQDDEEKENRPQPGALTPSVGALSA